MYFLQRFLVYDRIGITDEGEVDGGAANIWPLLTRWGYEPPILTDVTCEQLLMISTMSILWLTSQEEYFALN